MVLILCNSRQEKQKGRSSFDDTIKLFFALFFMMKIGLCLSFTCERQEQIKRVSHTAIHNANKIFFNILNSNEKWAFSATCHAFILQCIFL